MKSIVIAALIVTVATPAFAQKTKTITGWSLIATGSALVAGSFNYDTSCPTGYSTHTIETGPLGQHETWCVSIHSYGSDVRHPPTSASFERPQLMWTGVGLASAGAVVLLLPKRVQKVAPSIQMTQAGWNLAKTVTW